MKLTITILCVLLCIAPMLLWGADSTLSPTDAKTRYQKSAKDAPVVFVPNRGQLVDSDGRPRPDLLYSSSGSGLKLYLRQTGMSYVFARVQEQTPSQPAISEATGKPMVNSPEAGKPTSEPMVSVYRVDIEFEGCNTDAEILGEDETEQYYNYYLAHCPQGITDVHGCRRVVYKNIYDNIDLVFHSSNRGIKYDFVVRPGGDPSDIKMQYGNAGSIGLKANQLRMNTPLGAIEEQAPVTYAIANGSYKPLSQNGRPVRSRFVLQDSTVGFAVEGYDRNQTLVIDPYVLWSTYLGGEGKEHVEGVTVEAKGYNGDGWEHINQFVIVSGWTTSANFPTATWSGKQIGTYQGNTDAFLAAVNQDGRLLWYTFFGGDEFDRADAIACVNPFRYSTNVYNDLNPTSLTSSLYAITGQTRSASGIAYGFVSGTPYQSTLAGESDAFLATFDDSGHRKWATYIGGTAEESGYDIAINVNEAQVTATIGITGTTRSSSFPVVPSGSATDWSFRGKSDAFIAVFNISGQLQWSRCFGGGYEDASLSIDADANHNWLIGGWTKSTDISGTVMFGRTSGTSAPADVDMMLALFNNSGAVVWSSYYGDQYDDYCTSVAFSGDGHMIIGGYAHAVAGGMYTMLARSYQQQSYGGGSYDGVLLKFDTMFENEPAWWSTHYGGDNDDRIEDIAVDFYGNIWVVGRTNSTETENIADGKLIGYQQDRSTGDWVVLQDARFEDPDGWKDRFPVYDTFLAKFNPEGYRTWSTYYGMESSNIGVSISSGYFYGIAVAGWTASPHPVEEIPIFHVDELQIVPKDCDEGFVMLMREFGFPTSKQNAYSLNGGNTSDAVAIDSEDNIIVASDESSPYFPVTPGAYQATLQASINGAIVKTDSNGAPIWCTYFGGSNNTVDVCLAIGPDDKILVGARQLSNFSDVINFSMKGDGYLALFTSYGLLSNTTTIGRGSGTRVNIVDVAFGPDNAIWAFGTTDAPIQPGYVDLLDGFIARYSPDLSNREWWRYVGGGGNDILQSGTVTDNNEIVITGKVDTLSALYTPVFPRLGLFASDPPRGRDEGFVAKFTCSGSALWSRFIGGNSDDYMAEVKVAADGTVVVLGCSFSTNFPVTIDAYSGSNGGGRDIVLTKLSGSDGSILWGTYIGGSGSEEPSSIVIDANNAVVLLGETWSNNYPTSPNALQNTRTYNNYGLGCITKFSSANQLEWSTYLGGSGSVVPLIGGPGAFSRNRIIADSRNNYLFVLNVGTNHNDRRAKFYYKAVGYGSVGDPERNNYYKLTKDGAFWSTP